MDHISWVVCLADYDAPDSDLLPEEEQEPSWYHSEADAIAAATYWRSKGYRVRCWRAEWHEMA